MIGEIYTSVTPFYNSMKKENSYKKRPVKLMQLSYVRTHKQITVHRAALTSQIGDLKNNYEELYLKVLERLETFNKKILDDAL